LWGRLTRKYNSQNYTFVTQFPEVTKQFILSGRYSDLLSLIHKKDYGCGDSSGFTPDSLFIPSRGNPIVANLCNILEIIR